MVGKYFRKKNKKKGGGCGGGGGGVGGGGGGCFVEPWEGAFGWWGGCRGLWGCGGDSSYLLLLYQDNHGTRAE